MEGQEATLEEILLEIEAIIAKMQQREVSLEDSFAMYEQGIRKLKQCNEKLAGVEKKMMVLNEQEQS